MKKFLQFLYWKFIDIKRRSKRYPYGVWMFVGLPGRGKTISMVEYLERMRKKYPDVKIYTNFHYKNQDGELVHWKQLIDIPGPVIFALDEVQLTFSSRDWQSFPPEMVTLLTQNRKMRKQLICSAQSFERVDKVFRELTQYVIECRTFWGRWTFCRAFETEDYMNGQDPRFGKRRFRAWRHSYIQTDYLRSLYDTMLQLDSLKKKDYLSLLEREKTG